MITNSFVTNALFVSFAATIISSVFMVLMRARGKKILELHIFFGKELLHGKLFGHKTSENVAGVFGLIAHFIAGTALGFAYFFIPIPHTVVTGLLFALLPWLFMLLVLFPLFRQGCCGNKLGKGAKWQTLIFHLIWGVVLGYFAAL